MAEDWEQLYASGAYREMWHADAPSTQLVTIVAAGIVPRGNSLDLGCGAGTQVAYLASQGFRAYGVDISASAVRIAHDRVLPDRVEAMLVVGSSLTLPFQSARFTFVTDRGCLHIIPADQWPAYAAEVARVTQPGGYFMLEGARPGAGRGFTPVTPEGVHGLFADVFEIGPMQEFAGLANVGSLDMWLAIMKRFG